MTMTELLSYRLLTHCDVKCAVRTEIMVLTVLPPVSTSAVPSSPITEVVQVSHPISLYCFPGDLGAFMYGEC